MSSSSSSLPLSTWDVAQEVQIRMLAKDGIAGQNPKTVLRVFDATVQKFGTRPALYQKRYKPGDDKKNVDWTIWTWQDYRDQVSLFGKALLTFGFQRFDIINIIGFNSPEWFIGNLGAIAAGGVSAGIYATNLPEACKYISSHSKAKVVICDGQKQLEKYYKISAELPDLKALVMYGTESLPDNIQELCPNIPVYTFEQFLKLGKSSITDKQMAERSNSWKPGETCSLIYTSGTTGPPKAVMITNDNITWTVDNMCLMTPRGYMTSEDSIVSYLPLSHIAAQMLDLYMPIATGTQIYFADPDALKGSLGATLKQVRPTAFFGVPRVYEKIYGELNFLIFSSFFASARSYCLRL
jgi:long-chain-fatty-acid--CoA ligase ACSBG